MEGYSAKVIDASIELSAKDRIKLKDLSDAVQLDSAIDEAKEIIIEPDYYAVVSVHNEKSDTKDYEKYVIVSKDGTKYVTGSEAFWSSFKDIYSDMAGEADEWGIKCYKLPSKNYAGRGFLTCSII